MSRRRKFVPPIKLHSSQTATVDPDGNAVFVPPIKLHSSQTIGDNIRRIFRVCAPYKTALLSNL